MKSAIYLRVSTNRQTQAQTIDQQLERLRSHLDLQGEPLLADYTFRDDGYSGANLNRPGLDRLRDRVKSGVIGRVLLTSPDRLARNYVHQMVLIEEWERCGCKVEFLDRPMSQDPHDQLLLQIRGAVAEYERVLIAERMRRGRQMKLKAGALLPWTVPPYGYRSAPDRPRDPSGVQIEPVEGAIVQELFARYLEDQGTLLSLARHLLQLRLPSPRGNQRWSAASIRGLLINPVYTGKLYIGRSRSRPARIRRSATHPLGTPARGQDSTSADTWILVGTIPALVSQEDFERVQVKLALNKKQATRNNKSHRYLLRALVSCGACQSACIARTTNGGLHYYVCRCQVQPIYSQHDQRCRARCIPAQQLDVLVWEDLCQLMTQPEYIIDALQRAGGGHWLPQDIQSRKQTLRKAQIEISRQLERLTEAYLISIIPLAEYQRRRSELEQKSHALEEQTKELEVQVDRRAELIRLGSSIEDFCRRIAVGLANAKFDQKRTLVELLIDRVLVANGEVEIRYVVPTHPNSEKIRFCHLRKDYFDDVVQVLHRPVPAPWRESSLLLNSRDCRGVDGCQIRVDDARLWM
jgi:site-specific DNA recombinase